MTAAALGRLVAAVATSVASGLPLAAATPAGASGPSAGSLRARAAAISASVAADTAALQRLGLAYLSEQATVRHARAQGAVLARRAVRAAAGVRTETVFLRRAAVDAYVSAGSTTGLGLVLAERPDELALSRTYLDVATRRIDEAASRLTSEERHLEAALAGKRRAEAKAQRSLAATARSRAGAIAAYDAERRLLASVHGQLADLVAAERAAAARAAAAAQAAADRAAAARAAAAQAAAARAAANRASASTTTVAASVATTPSSSPPGTAPPPSPGPGGPDGSASGPPDPSGNLGSAPASGTIASDLAGIRNCESGGNYGLDTGNGYYGAYQFSLGTWEGLGGTGLPSSAPPGTQDAAAYRLYKASGWSPWPACAALLGLG